MIHFSKMLSSPHSHLHLPAAIPSAHENRAKFGVVYDGGSKTRFPKKTPSLGSSPSFITTQARQNNDRVVPCSSELCCSMVGRAKRLMEPRNRFRSLICKLHRLGVVTRAQDTTKYIAHIREEKSWISEIFKKLHCIRR